MYVLVWVVWLSWLIPFIVAFESIESIPENCSDLIDLIGFPNLSWLNWLLLIESYTTLVQFYIEGHQIRGIMRHHFIALFVEQKEAEPTLHFNAMGAFRAACDVCIFIAFANKQGNSKFNLEYVWYLI